MRTFYIFKIKKELNILTKEIPYNLYHTIENLYYLDTSSPGISFNIYHDIFDEFDKLYLDKLIMSIFQNNKHYMFYDGKHIINNKYRPENSTLKVYKSHMILKSNQAVPSFLKNYLMSDNLFVCDFKNKDYFWLNEFESLIKM